MAQSDLLLKFNAARAAVDQRGVFTREIAEALQKLIQVYNENVATANSDLASLAAAQFLVATGNANLSAERVTTDTTTISWDHGTAGQAKASVVDGSITVDKLATDYRNEFLLGGM